MQHDHQWSFNLAGSVVNGDVRSIVPTGNVGVGTNDCTANVNSTGVIGEISGSGSVAANDLTLNAAHLPLNAFRESREPGGGRPPPGCSVGLVQ